MSGALIKQINQRIKDDGGADDVIELNLSELKLTTITPEIKKVLDKAKNVEVVLLSDNQLENLDNLPDWKLTAFDLSSNKLADAALPRLARYADLAQLILTNNQISSLDALKPLFALAKLEELELSENPVADLPNYREILFREIPSLVVLDRRDKDGVEVAEEDELEDDGEGDSEDEEFDDDEEDYEESESESPPKKKKK